MSILAFSLDPALIRPTSSVSHRLQSCFIGTQVTYIVFCAGARTSWEKNEFRVISTGGQTKVGRLFRGIYLALQLPKPGIVLAQDAGFLGLIAWGLAYIWHARFYLQDHSAICARTALRWRDFVLQPLAAFLYRRADAIRAVSERAKRGLIAHGVRSERIAVFPIRQDLAAFFSCCRSPDASPRIVCVARLEWEKGVDILLDAFACLSQKNASLVIFGEGSQRRALVRRAECLGIEKRVTFAGQVGTAELCQAFARATLYVQPSRFEGWGLAVIEAAAAGLPIVMSDVGCAGELLRHQVEVLLVPVENQEALTRAMQVQMEHLEVAKAMGKCAREAVRDLPGSLQGFQEFRRWIGLAS